MRTYCATEATAVCRRTVVCARCALRLSLEPPTLRRRDFRWRGFVITGRFLTEVFCSLWLGTEGEMGNGSLCLAALSWSTATCCCRVTFYFLLEIKYRFRHRLVAWAQLRLHCGASAASCDRIPDYCPMHLSEPGTWILNSTTMMGTERKPLHKPGMCHTDPLQVVLAHDPNAHGRRITFRRHCTTAGEFPLKPASSIISPYFSAS